MLTIALFAVAVAAGPCDGANSTTDIVLCYDRRARAADARLNAAYRAARGRVSAVQAQRLQVAQRAWIAYRDANCRAYAAGEGTITRIEVSQCRFDTTRARADELEGFGRRN